MSGWKEEDLALALKQCSKTGTDPAAFDPSYCLEIDSTPCFKTPGVDEFIVSENVASAPLPYLPGVDKSAAKAQMCATVEMRTNGDAVWSTCAGDGSSSSPASNNRPENPPLNPDTANTATIIASTQAPASGLKPSSLSTSSESQSSFANVRPDVVKQEGEERYEDAGPRHGRYKPAGSQIVDEDYSRGVMHAGKCFTMDVIAC